MIRRDGDIDAERAAAVLARMATRGLLGREERAAILWAVGRAGRIGELEREVLALRVELESERAKGKGTV